MIMKSLDLSLENAWKTDDMKMIRMSNKDGIPNMMMLRPSQL